MDQVGHFGGNQGGRPSGALQQMLLQKGGGFREAMGEQLGGFEALEGHGPAVLPMQRQTSQNGEGRENTKQRAVSQTVQTTHQRRSAGNFPGRKRSLNQLQSRR